MKTRKVRSCVAATLGIALALSIGLIPAVAEARPVRAIVPDGDNLQYLSFWVARGAGLFKAEGLEVEITLPENPRGTTELVKKGGGDVFVLPPPIALELVADHYPFVLVASLLEKDPINVVVRKSVMQARGLSQTQPFATRVAGLKGLKIGVAPGPPPRLRALLAAAGLDADKDIQMTIVPGKMQNAAFGDGSVDALYAHTPFLEHALLDQDGVLLVNQSSGEVAAIATPQIHALGVTQHLRDTEPDTVRRLVHAITSAETLIHSSQARAVDGVLAEFPTMDRRHVELIVRIYEPAIPQTPAVTAEGLKHALVMFPPNRTLPDLATTDFTPYVDGSFVREGAVPVARSGVWSAVAFGIAAAVLAGLLRLVSRARARSRV